MNSSFFSHHIDVPLIPSPIQWPPSLKLGLCISVLLLNLTIRIFIIDEVCMINIDTSIVSTCLYSSRAHLSPNFIDASHINDAPSLLLHYNAYRRGSSLHPICATHWQVSLSYCKLINKMMSTPRRCWTHWWRYSPSHQCWSWQNIPLSSWVISRPPPISGPFLMQSLVNLLTFSMNKLSTPI